MNMKIYVTILLGIILSAITLYFVADYYEHGETNALLMYLIVYLLPFVGLSLFNGIVLKFAENRNKYLKIFFAILLPVVSTVLLFVNDASLNFIGLTALIVFTIINFIWLAINLEDLSGIR